MRSTYSATGSAEGLRARTPRRNAKSQRALRIPSQGPARRPAPSASDAPSPLLPKTGARSSISDFGSSWRGSSTVSYAVLRSPRTTSSDSSAMRATSSALTVPFSERHRTPLARLQDRVAHANPNRPRTRSDHLWRDGDCQRALDSLKYFSSSLCVCLRCRIQHRAPRLVSGEGSTNAGAVSLCFEEFLLAAGRRKLLDAYRNRIGGPGVHQHLNYYFLGGMPEAEARRFFVTGEFLRRTCEISAISQCERDFGKYAGRLHAQHIGAVFSNVPRQVASSQDGSVRRFRSMGVVARKRGYQGLAGPIEWLHAAKLVRKCFPINAKPTAPMVAQSRQNILGIKCESGEKSALSACVSEACHSRSSRVAGRLQPLPSLSLSRIGLSTQRSRIGCIMACVSFSRVTSTGAGDSSSISTFVG